MAQLKKKKVLIYLFLQHYVTVEVVILKKKITVIIKKEQITKQSIENRGLCKNTFFIKAAITLIVSPFLKANQVMAQSLLCERQISVLFKYLAMKQMVRKGNQNPHFQMKYFYQGKELTSIWHCYDLRRNIKVFSYFFGYFLFLHIIVQPKKIYSQFLLFFTYWHITFYILVYNFLHKQMHLELGIKCKISNNNMCNHFSCF